MTDLTEQDVRQLLKLVKYKHGPTPLTPEQAESAGWFKINPTGLCLCGCGQKTKIAKITNKKLGYLVGQPRLWLQGHHNSGIGGRLPVEDGKKWCYACKQNVLLDKFYPLPTKSGGLYPYCIPCIPKIKAKHRYGIPYEEFEEMHRDQGGKCKICSRETKLVIDHDHDTGEIRGLLCSSCNSRLSLFDRGNLKNVLAYLLEAEKRRGSQFNKKGFEPA